MLKGRGRDPRPAAMPAHLARLSAAQTHPPHTPQPLRAPLAKPEPDYEVVEFPTDQYVNAKLQPPPPPPPRPPTGHPVEAGASCGLCGGGGARVRCTECGRRALCASCDDMYHRHPKRRNHQRLALTSAQLREDRPPLPPKTSPPVPPPRRHKLTGDRSSASPRPPNMDQQRRSTIGHLSTLPNQHPPMNHAALLNPSQQQLPPHLNKLVQSQPPSPHHGSTPYLPNVHHNIPPVQQMHQANTLAAWGRQRGSLQGFNVHPNMVPMPTEAWESPESVSPSGQSSPWGRPLRRGASVLELGGGAPPPCGGCAHCAGGWRYGSCASLEHAAWGGAWPPPACCAPPHHHPHHHHLPYTPQPHRRVESRAVSRAVSRAGSRAASPAQSVRSRASRRARNRSPSPPPLPSSDADSESETDSDRAPPPPERKDYRDHRKETRAQQAKAQERKDREISERKEVRSPAPPLPPQRNDVERETRESSLGPPPPPPDATWQCEFCTFVNEPGVRVCVVCCRTPTEAPCVVSPPAPAPAPVTSSPPRVTSSPRVTSPPAETFSRLNLNSSPARSTAGDTRVKLNGETPKARLVKEKKSTGCGPSPPRENVPLGRLVTPTREQSDTERTRHDMGVGPSLPAENNVASESRGSKVVASKLADSPVRHNVSVGPSPPRSNTNIEQSPPEGRPVTRNVANTGTSPPPQSISTQTYEVANSWERAPSVSRGRSRRRLRDDARRDRSHSRHSLSSDTRESDRSARTSGTAGGGGGVGRWEWRDSSPAGEWGAAPPPPLARRASHLDLRRARPDRRPAYYGSEAASPERLSSNRALSMEALAGVGARREAERGLELARLMTDAERIGFSAAEVHAALAQNPVAPLAWLSERWPSLVSGVRAAAARLAPAAGAVSENEARAALARHRGAMWPAVTDCVDRHRRQTESLVGRERRVRGRVWGSPAGADDDAAPSSQRPLRARADDSSDEYEAPIPTKDEDDDWMYLPLDPPQNTYEVDPREDLWNEPPNETTDPRTEEIALKLKSFLIQAGVPSIDENLLLKGLLADNNGFKSYPESNASKDTRPQSMDLAPFENDFIDAYNALTRASPLPNINKSVQSSQKPANSGSKSSDEVTYDLRQTQQPRNSNNINDIEATVNFNVSQSQNRIQTGDNSQPIEKGPQNEPIVNDVPPTQSPVNEINEIEHNSNRNQNIKVHTDSKKPHIEASTSNDQNLKTKEQEEILDNLIADDTSSNIVLPYSKPHSSQSALNIQNNKKIPKSETQLKVQRRKPPPRSERSTPEEEKTSNLSDIVGSTQRLIQQMKDEINSDINSIDGHSMSQSEVDYSSNESDFTSEHESSYSGSEETGDITSDENAESSTEDDNNVESQKSGTVMNRTTSEENEEFEEAMDHMEEQNESFKQTNIEILDSIARSLQEDHTVTLEIKNNVVIPATLQASELNISESILNDEIVHNVQGTEVLIPESVSPRPPSPVIIVLRTAESPKPAAPTMRLEAPKVVMSTTNRQDINNNLFVKVNSFDEIYEELSTTSNASKDENVKSEKSQSPKSNKNHRTKKSPVKEPKHSLPKKEIVVKPKEEVTVKPVITLHKHEITTSVYNVQTPTRLIITHIPPQTLTAIVDVVDEPETEDIDVELIGANETKTINANPIGNTSNNITDANEEEESDESASEGSLSDASKKTVSPVKEIINNTISNLISELDQVSDKIQSLNAMNILPESTQPKERSKSKSPEKQERKSSERLLSRSPIKQKSISPEKHKGTSPENQMSTSPEKQKSSSPEKQINVSKSLTANKSQIPKLMKNASHNKQNSGKSAPKVIASKVPIRRGSIKQYPAPSPPKFGNVQNGHVKQLQTRLFNDKAIKNLNSSAVSEPVPSTSTLNKKRPAPLPPSQSTATHSQEKASPPKEIKNYFRETCRTEDEWTESDSESDSAVHIVRQDSSEPIRAPSPPPPITVRRVSGQLIDLARIRLLEGSPERQARMLLAEGALENWDQAQLAVELVSRGTDPPAALLAALECVDLDSALTYLHQDCELCASRLPEHEMVSMLRCTHRCCRECARLYFTVQITERSIVDCVCPFCKEPELENLSEDAWLEYFAHLDILLKTLVDIELHELFQRKLRDRTLARDPNFRWCVECSSGFFVHPKQKKLRCPECRSVSCAKCRKPWTSNHEGLSCEQYAAWLEDNDPERSVAAVQQHLRENGLECPRCHFKYSLSRGGCMHFTCTQCKYEFCYGCGKPFMMGARCGLSEYCARLGLHAHHPRNCLFYLRDKEPHDLQTLLQMNNVSYETKAPEGSTSRCPIQLQKETPTGLVDTACGSDVPPDHAGLCKNHYLEYLSRLVRGARVDPLPLLGVDDLETLVRRAALRLPPRPYGTLEGLYKRALAEIVRDKIPLE